MRRSYCSIRANGDEQKRDIFYTITVEIRIDSSV